LEREKWCEFQIGPVLYKRLEHIKKTSKEVNCDLQKDERQGYAIILIDIVAYYVKR